MFLIVGLGNPGEEYKDTRHNVGFMIADQVKKSLEFENFHKEKKFDATISIGLLKGEKVILAKPLTFMNNSGEAVFKILQFYKIPLENCIIAYDDLDLRLGQIRIRKKGGPGTHNGMKSIVATLGNDQFPRLRFGIESRGEAAPKDQETSSFVLSSFHKEEKDTLAQNIQKASEALKTILIDGIEKAMDQFNQHAA